MSFKATRVQAIAAMLKAKTHPDLAAMYGPNMECQVNVAQDGGQRVQAEFRGHAWQGYTDGIQTWKMIRIPHNAATEPNYEDRPMTFDIAAHAEAIGMTGWDWKNRMSLWVAFDFDAITGHSDKHQKKLTEEELAKIRETVEGVEWVTIRKSTGGKGLHIYVFITPTMTQNHNEHAALARAILGKLSAFTGSNLQTQVDTCGQNMWVWHRKMNDLNDGLKLLKRGSVLTDIPSNWKDHVKVISGHRRRVLPKFLDGSGDDQVERKFNDLSNQITQVPLDKDHQKLVAYLEENGTGSWWDADNHMLVTHTYWLKKAHIDLEIRGPFETEAEGKDAPTDVNVFAYPLRGGSWVCRRYSMGVRERDSWEQDGRGWTRCYYNADPTVPVAARTYGGLEDPAGGFIFNQAELAADAARLLGADIDDVPLALKGQTAKIKTSKDGRIVVEIDGDKNGLMTSDKAMKGWLWKKGKWTRIFNVNNSSASESEGTIYDDQVRHMTTNNGDDAGWALRGETLEWRREPLVHIQSVLHTMGLKAPEIKTVIGNSIVRAWKLVNRPFQPEYPGDRIWNERGAQFRFLPSQGENLNYPHWKMILDHVGSGLDSAIQSNGWARNNGILTGADYLKLWIASLFKEPLQPLPYLFFYGPQNSGKSIFHEALSLLFTRGYVRADAALTSQGNFNAELANAVLCVVEEINLRHDKNAANRIKDWVTARDISIHQKGHTPYQIQNATHWIQVSNESTACPVLPGDTRITSSYVAGFEDITKMVPKKFMMAMLEKEAADFLGEVLSLDIPPSNDRLNVPVIRTAEKASLEAFNRTPVEQFFAEKMFPVEGEMVEYAHAYDMFVAFLDPSEAAGWSKQKFGREIPPQYPKGRSRSNAHHCIGNVSLAPMAPTKPKLVATAPDKNDLIFLDPEVKNGDNP